MKGIDEELVSQIKTVFENFDDELSENGWARLREKYPEKQDKKLPFWWLSGIAAAVLIAIGLFFALDKPAQKIDNGQQIVKEQPIIKQKTDNGINIPSTAKEETRPAKNFKENKVDRRLAVKPAIAPKKSLGKKPIEKDAKTETVIAKIENEIITNPIVIDVKKETAIAKVEQPSKNESLNNQKADIQKSMNQNIGVTNKVDTVQKIKNQNKVIANNNGAVKDPVVVKKTTEQFLNDQSKILAQKPKEELKTKETKSSIEVFSGTFLNYYANNAAKLNAGIGVNANVKLTKSLFVSFGAGISQNKIVYQKSIPSEVSRSMSSYSADAVVSSPNNNPGSFNSTTVSDISINAQLLNFDIPVSIKFYPTKKQNFYLATGINSNTYLSQKYTYGYNLTNKNVLGITQTAKQEETEKSKVNGFDFATSAIFAIGINQSIGKNSLTFEPYFKPAIGNMGEKNLRINTVGINLKFNFTSNKK